MKCQVHNQTVWLTTCASLIKICSWIQEKQCTQETGIRTDERTSANLYPPPKKKCVGRGHKNIYTLQERRPKKPQRKYLFNVRNKDNPVNFGTNMMMFQQEMLRIYSGQLQISAADTNYSKMFRLWCSKIGKYRVQNKKKTCNLSHSKLLCL